MGLTVTGVKMGLGLTRLGHDSTAGFGEHDEGCMISLKTEHKLNRSSNYKLFKDLASYN
jgi:hypothetical protein